MTKTIPCRSFHSQALTPGLARGVTAPEGEEATMLTSLYKELLSLNDEVQRLVVSRRDEAATALLDRIIEIEDEIVAGPAKTLTDAGIKLQLLGTELQDQLTDRQREMLHDVVTVLLTRLQH
jgi:hypothetical protein